MKNLLTVCLALWLSTAIVAQDIQEPIRVGVYTAIKGSTNSAAIPTGWKTGLVIESMPDIGVSATVPISQANGIAALVDIGYASMSVRSRPYTGYNDSNTIEQRSGYVCIAPSISLPYGFIGLSIGVPLRSSLVSMDGTTNLKSVMDGSQISSLVHQLAIVSELRVAGILPLVEDDQGILSAYGLVSYQLSSSYKNFVSSSTLLYNSTKTSSENDPKVISLSIGLRYMFNWTAL